MNLLSGIVSLYLGMIGELQLAASMIFVAAFLDFFDGLLARLLNAKTEIGAQLDSLADIVSFGVAPAFILFHTFGLPEVPDFFHTENFSILYFEIPLLDIHFDFKGSDLKFIAFIVPLFSALRLAKFNIDDDQTTSFKGLPTPATGILLASFPIMILVCLAENKGLYYDIVTNPWFLAATAIAVSLLMVSNLPMFALKFTSASWSENQTRYIFLILSVFLIIILKLAAIPLIILMYILLSIVEVFAKKKPESD